MWIAFCLQVSFPIQKNQQVKDKNPDHMAPEDAGAYNRLKKLVDSLKDADPEQKLKGSQDADATMWYYKVVLAPEPVFAKDVRDRCLQYEEVAKSGGLEINKDWLAQLQDMRDNLKDKPDDFPLPHDVAKEFRDMHVHALDPEWRKVGSRMRVAALRSVWNDLEKQGKPQGEDAQLAYIQLQNLVAPLKDAPDSTQLTGSQDCFATELLQKLGKAEDQQQQNPVTGELQNLSAPAPAVTLLQMPRPAASAPPAAIAAATAAAQPLNLIETMKAHADDVNKVASAGAELTTTQLKLLKEDVRKLKGCCKMLNDRKVPFGPHPETKQFAPAPRTVENTNQIAKFIDTLNCDLDALNATPSKNTHGISIIVNHLRDVINGELMKCPQNQDADHPDTVEFNKTIQEAWGGD